MIRRTFRVGIQLLGALGAGIAVTLLVLSWRLSSGPISLAFLSPYVTAALSTATPGYQITFDDTILTWAGWDRTLDIRVVNVRAMGGGGSVAASVPQLSLSLSAQALLRGEVAPRSIELHRTDLRLVRRDDGTIEIGIGKAGGASEKILSRRIADLFSVPEGATALHFLNRVSITDADLTIEDRLQHTVWRAPATQINLRRDSDGIKGMVFLDLLVGDEHAQLAVDIDYREDEGKLEFGIGFDDLNPAVFSRVTPALRAFADANLPLSGDITVGMGIDGVVNDVRFAVRGGRGSIALPAPVAQRLDVESAEVQGRFHGDGARFDIDRLHVDFGPKGTIFLPMPVKQDMPLRSLLARGRLLGEAGRLEVEALELDLHGPHAELALTADGLSVKGFGGLGGPDGDVTMEVKGSLRDLSVDDLERYWPEAWGTAARDWSVTNLSHGMMRHVNAALSLRWAKDGAFELIAVDGDVAVDGVTVDYLAPMPKVRKTAATMTFDRKRLEISLAGGESQGLSLRQGTVIFTGLDEVDQYADVDMVIDGPVRNTLQLIDRKPFGFATVLGVVPADTAGDASTRLKLKFIVEHALTKNQVDVLGTSTLANVSVAKAVFGRALHGGTLELRVDRKGLDVSGKIMLGDIPADLTWRENFETKAPFRSRYGFRGTIEDIGALRDLGFDAAATMGDIITGPVGVAVGLTVFEEQRGRLEAAVDLANAAIALPALGWAKARGVAGAALINAQMQGTQITDAPRIDITAGDLTVAASAQYAPDRGGFSRIDFERLEWGKNNIAGWLVSRADGGWDANVSGQSVDLEYLWARLLNGDPDDHGNDAGGPRFTLDAKVARVWMGPGRFMDNVRGTFVNDGRKWRRMSMESQVGEGKLFTADISETGDGKRSMAIHADDAGAVLRVFDYYENMIGGTMTVLGEYDDMTVGSPLKGRLEIRDYRVVRAPAIAHLVSILALTGIIDALEGDGLAFKQLAAPFVISDGVLEFNDARASGTSLGFTASGKFYTHAEMMNVEGTVIPAYLINAIWGRIPILGKLFTGGEEGGGVFAANFRMTGPKDDPEISVNPLSALAPGFLRNIFDIFEDDNEVSQRSGKKIQPRSSP